jgi:denticleless
VWDLRKNYSAYKRDPVPCHTLPYPGKTSQNGFTNLVLDPGKIKLYASCMDSVIYCYNVATYESKPSELCNILHLGFLHFMYNVSCSKL